MPAVTAEMKLEALLGPSVVDATPVWIEYEDEDGNKFFEKFESCCFDQDRMQVNGRFVVRQTYDSVLRYVRLRYGHNLRVLENIKEQEKEHARV